MSSSGPPPPGVTPSQPFPPSAGYRMPPPATGPPPHIPPPGYLHPPPMPPTINQRQPFNIPPPGFLGSYGTEPSGAVISAGPQLTNAPPVVAVNSPHSGSSSPSINTQPAAIPTSVPPLQPPPMPNLTLPGVVASAEVAGTSTKDKKGVWTEHKSPDGRVYYYNTTTRQSSWDKPDALKTPSELLLSQFPWKEHKADNGKTYYHNVKTQESRWTIPKELEELKKKIAKESTDSSNETDKKSAIEKAMAATLAAIDSTEPGKKKEVNKKGDSVKPSKPLKPEKPLVFKDKKEAIEAFKEFLKEKDVASDATWDKAVRLMQNDSRFDVFNRLSERKQAFHAYKVQRSKEEKEEQRLRIKKAKEDLEAFLMDNEQMNSSMKYYRLDDMFQSLDVWKNVPESERRDIYEDVVFALGKKEKEATKTMRKRNMKVLSEILDSMTTITFKTTWSDAQILLIENPVFADDAELLSMDKEDALVVFSEHIKQLEREEEEEREKEKKRIRRQHRKARDDFHVLLDELHESGKLTSMSLWVELYPIISADVRFSVMLGNPGSTPLDLFKFYVADLKSRFHHEKKIIKEILKEKVFEVQTSTTFRDFALAVCGDSRSGTLDAGNVKLTYNALIEKAEARDKERQREEARKMKKIEQNFKQILKSADVSASSEWESVRDSLRDTSAFHAITVEAERIRIFKEYQQYLEETCGHRHAKSKKKSKKKDRRRSRSPSYSSSDSVARHRRHTRSRSRSYSEETDDDRRRRKKKSKKRRAKSRSYSESSDESHRSSRKQAKKKRRRSRSSRSASHEIRCRAKTPDKGPRNHSPEEGELSEDELEKKRALLMKQLEQI